MMKSLGVIPTCVLFLIVVYELSASMQREKINRFGGQMEKKLFLDIEASSLGWHSYPIEVAWGCSTDHIESYLISPKSIPEWTDWSEDAEELHGISRAILLERGAEPSVVCNAFLASSQGCEVYTNNPCWDAMWLHKLFFYGSQKIPVVDMRHSDELLWRTVSREPENRLEGLYSCLKIKRNVANALRSRHRAAVDVEYLIKIYERAENGGILKS